MRSFTVKNIKELTSQLFVHELFDRFLLCEAELVTFQTYSVNGRVKKEYYTQEEQPQREFSLWSQTRPFLLSLIKGRTTPLSFKLVFTISRSGIQELVTSSGTSLSCDDIDGVYMTVSFKDGRLQVVTGTSLKIFSMDKTLERYWDQKIEGFLAANDFEAEAE